MCTNGRAPAAASTVPAESRTLDGFTLSNSASVQLQVFDRRAKHRTTKKQLVTRRPGASIDAHPTWPTPHTKQGSHTRQSSYQKQSSCQKQSSYQKQRRATRCSASAEPSRNYCGSGDVAGSAADGRVYFDESSMNSFTSSRRINQRVPIRYEGTSPDCRYS